MFNFPNKLPPIKYLNFLVYIMVFVIKHVKEILERGEIYLYGVLLIDINSKQIEWYSIQLFQC